MGMPFMKPPRGKMVLLQAVNVQPALIILDLGLPGINGIEVTRRIREWTDTPIIILSVQNQDSDKIEALDAGADDFLTKPFSVGELTARLRVAMRHARKDETEPVYRVGKLCVDLAARVVTCGDEEVQLTPTEYDLLKVLVQYFPGGCSPTSSCCAKSVAWVTRRKRIYCGCM